MNNKVFQEKKDEYAETRHRIEVELTQTNLVLEAIRNLRENPDYIVFKRNLLDDAVQKISNETERLIKELKNDKQHEILHRILQNQGMLTAFKKFANLDELEKVFKVESERLTESLKNAQRKKG